MTAVSNIRVAQELEAREEPILCTAETAECTCPDFCERDHETD